MTLFEELLAGVHANKPKTGRPKGSRNGRQNEQERLSILMASPKDGLLPVFCYCGEILKRIKPSIVRLGFTHSCGKPECKHPAMLKEKP